MKQWCSFIYIGLWIISGLVCSVQAKEVNTILTSDQSHPLVNILETQYDAYRESQSKGDTETYKNIRATKIVNAMLQHLKQQNKLNEFTSVLQKSAKGGYNYSDFQFLSLNAVGNTARLAYSRPSKKTDASGQPRIDFLLIMFHQEEVWKIGYIKFTNAPEVKEDGTITTLDDVTIDAKFRLP